MTDFRSRADEALAGAYEEPMSLSEYVNCALDRPTVAAHAAKYLLDAIEARGTRTVVEEGEERERYRFFDDPHNDGEHAVLGNTAVLNAFVDDLRTVAAGRGKAEKMFWFDGPTATGKSELKRCLVNGLREYSKTPAGRRYTLEWNIEGVDEDDRSLSYGGSYEDEDDWYESPVQTHPLSVFPDEVRDGVLAELNERSDDHVPTTLDADLDPFSREAYEYLMSAYRREGRPDPFSAATDHAHLRVTNYVVDVGRGIGVLHAEDDGSPKERLVGSWMPGMLQELDSRGRKNPQAFSYDGVLSQGNGLLTVVEDATQHADLLRKLLNVPDEGRVKLDKGIGMDVDTLLVVISNPDLDAELDQFADRDAADPLKALKRRLDKHRFRYLTETSLEAQLIRRELTDETPVWTGDRDDIESQVREPLSLSVRDDRGDVRERELAPHTVAAAALYSVVTRLDGDDLPTELSLVEKARLYDRGFIRDGDDRREAESFDLDGEDDGVRGVPVTYTRDVVADLLHETPDRAHPELAVESVVMPDDVLDEMANGLVEAPVFSRSEAAEYENRVAEIKEAVFDRQEKDVLDAVLAEKTVEEETVAEYVEHVFAWSEAEKIDTGRGLVDPDPLLMKVFETEHLGRFGDADYRGNEPRSQVVEFRTEEVITALNRYAWQNRDEGFEVDDVDLAEVPVIRSVLDTHSWSDVRRLFEDFDPGQWADPPTNTETERVKDRTIEELCERGYSPASAELTSRKVLREVSHRWD